MLNNGSINSTQSITDEQVKFVVQGFVQVWNKFEDILARELSTKERLKKSGSAESRLNNSPEVLFRVGTVLNSHPGITMGELSYALSVPLSTATRVVDALVDQGYVQRLPDKEDRRIVRISFTPLGRELYNFVDTYITERIHKIASRLTQDEMAMLITLLGRVAQAVEDTMK